MTYIVFASEPHFRAAVDVAAAFPIALDDARALKRQAAGILEDGDTAPGVGFSIDLSAALDAVRAARRLKHGTPRKPAGFRPFARRGR